MRRISPGRSCRRCAASSAGIEKTSVPAPSASEGCCSTPRWRLGLVRNALMKTIYERALEIIKDGMIVGLGSGKASTKFIELLGPRVKAGLKVRGVPTSEASDALAKSLGIPLIPLDEALTAGGIDVAVDGADECDPNLDLVKGWGRALIREKVVEASSKKFVCIFDKSKLVPKLGTRGKLPVEVAPFARALCEKRLKELGGTPTLWTTPDGKPART